MHDVIPACDLLRGVFSLKLLADRAYDTNNILALAKEQNQEPVIPPKQNQIEPRTYDEHVYKERHLIECFFQKLKAFRRVATRFDKLAITYKATINLAACLIWLK